MVTRLLLILSAAATLPAQTYLLTTVLGNQSAAITDGPVKDAYLGAVESMTVDASGNLYLTGAGRIRRITPDGFIHTVAGTGHIQSSGDGGLATQAGIAPRRVTVDSDGSIYFTETPFHRVRRITPDGYIDTVFGTGVGGSAPDQLNYPQNVVVDTSHNFYIADSGNARIVKVRPDGTATSFAASPIGAPELALSSSGVLYQLSSTGCVQFDTAGNQTEVPLTIHPIAPMQLTAGPNGELYYLDYNGTVYRFVPGSATQATDLVQVFAFAVASDGVFYTYSNSGLLRVDSSGITVITGAGHAPAGFGSRNFAIDGEGAIYAGPNPLRKIDLATGDTTIIAGTGQAGFSGDGGPARNATLSGVRAVTVSARGEIYFVDTTRIRKVDGGGRISTVAGIDGYGYNGDNIAATQAALGGPSDIAISPQGDLYICDHWNHRIRRVDAGGIITTVVGTGVSGWSGDGGPASAAQLSSPEMIVFDPDGNLYIADSEGERIRKVTASGTITTLAHDLPGYTGGMDRDAQGNLFLTDWLDCAIIKVTPAGVAEKIAGNGTCGLEGDAGPGLLGSLQAPFTIHVAASGTLLFADGNDGGLLRKIEPANIFPRTVVNAGSWRNNPLAPGELVTLYWTGLASPVPQFPAVVDGRFPTTLAGTQVLFDDVPAPILYLDSNQINTVVPYTVAGRPATAIQVVSGGSKSNKIGMPVQAASPGLFAILDEDYSFNSLQKPATRGGVLVLFGTGAGPISPSADGVATPGTGTLGLPAAIRIDNQPATIQYAGPAPGLISGVFQINVVIPPQARAGTVPLFLTIGDFPAESGLEVVLQ